VKEKVSRMSSVKEKLERTNSSGHDWLDKFFDPTFGLAKTKAVRDSQQMAGELDEESRESVELGEGGKELPKNLFSLNLKEEMKKVKA